MGKDLSSYSTKEKARIARIARRNLNSEVTLICASGFAGLMVCMFVFGRVTFLPIAEVLGARPTIVWVVLSFLLASLFAALHYFTAKPKILAARDLDAAFLHAYQAQQRREREVKLKQFRSKT